MTTIPRIAIVGGGPGGLMLARLLQLRGVRPIVFERDANPDDRPQGGTLDLHAETGQRAMRIAQLEDEFLAHARPEDQGDRLYDPAGNLLFDHDGQGDDRPEIDRTALRAILLDSLDPGTVRWGNRIETITAAAHGGCDIITGDIAEHFDIVIGADGGWSRVRPLLSDATPIYEGATMVELGFDTRRHPAVDALVGTGKMFAVGDNRVLIAQRNGHGHIRGYAGLRMTEAEARQMSALAPEQLRAMAVTAFAGWAAPLLDLIESGDILGLRPLYALPIGHRWTTRPGITLLGDAAHLMSPFSGEDVNLALSDAAYLADALMSDEGWAAVSAYEAAMIDRATPAAQGAAAGLNSVLSSNGVSAVLDHYRERTAA